MSYPLRREATTEPEAYLRSLIAPLMFLVMEANAGRNSPTSLFVASISINCHDCH